MANPRHRHTATRRGKRRSHDHLKERSLTRCPQCLEPKLPHRVCLSCGTYKGKPIVEGREA